MSETRKRILIAEDHMLLRTGLIARLGQGVAAALVLLCFTAPIAHLDAAAAEGQAEAGPAPKHPARRHHVAGQGLDDRIKALTKALDLDAKQQAELRKVLESQREQVRKVWDDATVPAGYRVTTTQAISDKTADQIRALLTEEQRKKYKPPRVPHEAASGAGTRSVEDWMNATQPK
jgi:protein CpxP